MTNPPEYRGDFFAYLAIKNPLWERVLGLEVLKRGEAFNFAVI